MNRILCGFLVTAMMGLAATTAQASLATGSYTTGGSTTGSGPWNITSTDTTFSVLRLVVNEVFTFADITDINYDYDSNQGGIGTGAPRGFVLFTDLTSLLIHWGPAGSYVDATIGNGLNTGNLVAMNDVGRYDLSGVGGSAYTNYAAALVAAGTKTVLRVGVLLDSFGGNDRDFDIHAINVEIPGGAVPEPGTVVVWSVLGLVATGCSVWRRKKTA